MVLLSNPERPIKTKTETHIPSFSPSPALDIHQGLSHSAPGVSFESVCFCPSLSNQWWCRPFLCLLGVFPLPESSLYLILLAPQSILCIVLWRIFVKSKKSLLSLKSFTDSFPHMLSALPTASPFWMPAASASSLPPAPQPPALHVDCLCFPKVPCSSHPVTLACMLLVPEMLLFLSPSSIHLATLSRIYSGETDR